MNKEQILLAVVLAMVAGVHFTDGTYVTVPVPSTTAPSDIPVLPTLVNRDTMDPPATKRSLFTIKPEFEDAPLVDLAPPPAPEVLLADPPFRPWVHLDAAVGFRHRLTDIEAEEEAAAPVESEEEAVVVDDFVADAEPPPKPLDLTTFDWVVVKGGLGTRSYGVLELLPADVEKGRKKWEVLVDPDLEFTWTQIDSRTGRRLFTQARYRERVESIGFAETIENLHEARLASERSGGKTMNAAAYRRVAAWIEEESARPRYSRIEGLRMAAENLENALRLTPDADTVKSLLRIYRSSWRPGDALTLCEWWMSRAASGGADPEFVSLRARILEDLGLRDRAIADYDSALVTRPDGEARLRLAGLLLSTGALGDARRAEEVYRRAVQDGERVAGAVGEARAVCAQGRVTEAESLLSRIPASDRDASWYNAMGSVKALLGRMGEAADHFEAAVTRGVSGDGTLAISRTNAALARARLAAAATDSTVRATEVRKALELADAALLDDPYNYYWPLVVRAYALRTRGDRVGALAALQEAIAAEPSEAYGRYLLGEFLLRDGRPEEARTQFLAATRMASGFPDALAGVGRAGGGKPGEAREYLRRAVELDHRSSTWYMLAARTTLFQEGLPEAQRIEDAMRDIEELLGKQEHKNYPLGHAHLGFIRYRRGDADGAIESWNTAGRLMSAVKPGSPEEALQTWLRVSREEVTRWRDTKIWRDTFLRPDGPQVGNRWNETEGSGVKISLVDGAAQFGRGQHVTGQDPKLHMDWDLAAKVRRIFVEVTLPSNEQCDAYVDCLVPGSGKAPPVALIGLRKKENGEVLIRIKGDNRDRDVKEYPLRGFTWPTDGKVTFGFVKEGDEGGMRVFVNGEAVKDPRVESGDGPVVLALATFAKSRGGKLRLEVGTEASAGAEVFLRVEAVEAWLDIR